MAASKYEREAQQESTSQKLLREWIQQRIALIHSHVSIYDVLRQKGITVEREDRPEQFSCPFHGKDNKPSARAYPESGGGPSHAWCFVCQERWDAISIWRKFAGPDKKFTRILTEIEQSFGLDQPEFPDGLTFAQGNYDAVEEDDQTDKFQSMLQVAERRLTGARHAFDFHTYRAAVSLLERVGNRVMDRRMSQAEGERRLQQILDKVRERERACPAG